MSADDMVRRLRRIEELVLAGLLAAAISLATTGPAIPLAPPAEPAKV